MPNYYPTYNPYLSAAHMPQVQAPAQAPVAQTPSILWVQGEAGAKSYLVGAGQSVLLMDSESSKFYIKSTDTSGMPMPLRVFEYEEKTQAQQAAPVTQANQYVTHEELKKWTDDLMNKIMQEGV